MTEPSESVESSTSVDTGEEPVIIDDRPHVASRLFFWLAPKLLFGWAVGLILMMFFYPFGLPQYIYNSARLETIGTEAVFKEYVDLKVRHDTLSAAIEAESSALYAKEYSLNERLKQTPNDRALLRDLINVKAAIATNNQRLWKVLYPMKNDMERLETWLCAHGVAKKAEPLPVK